MKSSLFRRGDPCGRPWTGGHKARPCVIFILSLFIGVSAFCFDRQEGRIHRVIDGDTVEMSGGERVRLIGINAPEYQPHRNHAQPYGKEASACAKALLDQQKVFIEHDIEKKDKYDRTLAYIFLESGEFANQSLVRQGCAKAGYYAPNGRYYKALKEAQAEAKQARRGVWAD